MGTVQAVCQACHLSSFICMVFTPEKDTPDFFFKCLDNMTEFFRVNGLFQLLMTV